MTGNDSYNSGRTIEEKGRAYVWYTNVGKGTDGHHKFESLAKRFSIVFLDQALDNSGKPYEGAVAVFVAKDEKEAFLQAAYSE